MILRVVGCMLGNAQQIFPMCTLALSLPHPLAGIWKEERCYKMKPLSKYPRELHPVAVSSICLFQSASIVVCVSAFILV